MIEKRIVKIYNSITDLENDNGTQGVQIDEDKILITDKNNLVLVFKVINRDIGNNYSENKSGIYYECTTSSNNGWLLAYI